MSLFDDRDLAAVTSPEFPGERLIVCRNADLARERARKREDLLKATERDLARIAAAVARKTKPILGAAEIGMSVGAVLDKHKMAKHFELTISDARFVYVRKTNQIAEEAALDGLYALRTSLPKETLDDHATVRAYKSLSMVDIDQTWRLSRIEGWGVWVDAGKQIATEWQSRRAGGFEFGDCGRVRGDKFVGGPEDLDRAAAQPPFLDPVIDRGRGRADFGGQFVDRPFVRATVRDVPRAASP